MIRDLGQARREIDAIKAAFKESVRRNARDSIGDMELIRVRLICLFVLVILIERSGKIGNECLSVACIE